MPKKILSIDDSRMVHMVVTKTLKSLDVEVITAVNGRPTETLSSFVAELERAGVNNSVELTVRRGERERRVKVQVIDLRE